MSAYCPFKSTTRSAVAVASAVSARLVIWLVMICGRADLIGGDEVCFTGPGSCGPGVRKHRFHANALQWEQKGWRRNLERRARRGDQAKEWSLTPDLLDIILKMQINLCFRNWSRTTRGQTSPWNQTKHPGITYTLKTKIHSKHMFQQFFYKSNSSTQSHKQTVRPKTHRKKVKKTLYLYLHSSPNNTVH